MGVFVPVQLSSNSVRSDDVVRATWAPHARRFVREWCSYRAALPEVERCSVPGIADYPVSFTMHLPLVPTSLRAGLVRFARQLRRLKAPSRIVLLTDLFDDQITGPSLHTLFAAVRAQLIAISGVDRSALYAPVTGSRLAFPLHADLWHPELLLNVFDHSASEMGGASLFLRKRTLLALLASQQSMPSVVRDEIRNCFGRHHQDHRFDRLYHLLHNRKHSWTVGLAAALEANQLTLALEPGQGYLIHDRHWLHGRTEMTHKPKSLRLFRLAFDSVSTTREH